MEVPLYSICRTKGQMEIQAHGNKAIAKLLWEKQLSRFINCRLQGSEECALQISNYLFLQQLNLPGITVSLAVVVIYMA